MKQIIQSYKTGKVNLSEVPVPLCSEKNVLVRTKASLISIGTERSIIDLGRKSLFGMAAARPDLVRRAWDKAKKEGLLKTYKEIKGRLDIPTPLGYSCAGIIEECGVAATEFSPGERVACIGQGFASHAEFVSMPVNLVCRIPENVTEDEASFGMLGIIALHGIRSANLNFGSHVVVTGLGLIGLLTIQILKAYGCEIICYDPAKDKVALAKKLGLENSTSETNELQQLADYGTQSSGVDAVIITASTKNSDPVNQAIQLCRAKGKIVVVGVTDIHPDRNELWQKEVELVVSKAAGPGSLDPLYELEGIDLPKSEVRWTQRRNLEEFMRLLQKKNINIQKLITHRFTILDSEKAYLQLMSGELKNPIGVLLEYLNETPIKRNLPLIINQKSFVSPQEFLQLGVVGAGLFGKAVFLPTLQKLKEVSLHTLATNSGANAKHSGSKFGFLNQTTDLKQIWKNPEIHAVIGLTPHSEHASLFKSAFENMKSLFLEKPLCTTEKELHELREIVLKFESSPIIMIGHNRRFSPHSKKIQSWLKKRNSPIVLQMRINSGFVPNSHWVHSEKEGRSRIVGEISHFIDFFQCLTGSNVVRVHAERISGNNKNAINNDNLLINMKFIDGSIANLTYSASGDKAYPREKLEIFFDGKTIFLEDFRISKLYANGKITSFKTISQEMGYHEELKHFVTCVSGNEKIIVSLEDMFDTMETIFAIERSLSTANVVNLKGS